MGATQYKINTKKNGVSMILDARKGENDIMIFYLKEKQYPPKVQEVNTNSPEDKEYGNAEK